MRMPDADGASTIGRVHRMFHVTSTRNRASIEAHGLDWSRMGAAPGIAGGRAPEVEGVFLCPDRDTVEWFLRLNNTGGPVDIWEISGVDEAELVDSPGGYQYLARPIDRARLTLLDLDVLARAWPEPMSGPTEAYFSTLTITLDDGTVLRSDTGVARIPEPPVRRATDRET
jgi:hypothetical protein